MLKFSFANSKINKLSGYLSLTKKQVVSFDLPAGFTCPAAVLCQTYANRATGKITDGKKSQFRCYAASGEAVFKSARENRWHNFDTLVHSADMVSEIESSLPAGVKVIRIHSSGDFFSKKYFDAWVTVAKNHPEIVFFGYTKVLPYLSYERPENMKLVYSHGGKYDNEITSEPVCYVVNTVNDAEKMGIPVSCSEKNPADDFDYIMQQRSFAIVLHGTQPAKKK